MPRLLYLSYGRDPYHLETMFSLLSARRFDGGEAPLVYTDRPRDYEWLGVETRELTPALIEGWVGAGGYPFRRKIACILDALGHAADALAFLDGDTYFRVDPRLLFERIVPGRACLHLREQRLTRRAGTAGAALQRLFEKGVVRDGRGAPVALHARESMWNSGVIGVHRDDAGRVEESLALIDEIWLHERSVHTLEQFALGHVFGEKRLRETDDLVFHYWHARQRAPFLARLPAIIEAARGMPLADAAHWSYAQRPVEGSLHRRAGVVRNILHGIGLDHRWTRSSF